MRVAAMNLFGARTFAHGIHPPQSKDETSGLKIHQFPFAPVLIVPLSQHIGRPALPIVREGQEVSRGQRIADPDGFMSVAIHAPASGVVQRIAPSPAINGKMEPSLFLEPYPASTQEELRGEPTLFENASSQQIREAIQAAGIVGLGGAGYPTHAKLNIPEGNDVDTIIINGIECEPYLTADHRVMLEHADDVVCGVLYLMRAAGAEQAIIAVEANKLDAAETLRAAIPVDASITVEILPVKYPQGAEQMVIKAVLGREVPPGGHPADVHALCVNASTSAEVGMLLRNGMGLQERVVTVAGPAIKKKGNYRIPIGTTLRFILDTVGFEEDISTVVMGGPMMGNAASSLDIPITKGTTGVIAFTERETGPIIARKQFPCIGCGYCVDACPKFLNPSKLALLAEHGKHRSMVEDFHLMDCFECGCCTYVCPSHIPLVQHFRVAKAAVRKVGRA